jgi:hypothetical protein
MRKVLQIFARPPVAGQVKTRLIPALGVDAATALYQQMLLHSLEQACQADYSAVQIWCAGQPEHSFFFGLSERFPISLHEQQGDDLGSRMQHALQQGLQDHEVAVLIGSDCPSLTSAVLKQAADSLGESAQVVIGPASDGGYYLIGMRSEVSRLATITQLFEGLPWGREGVLQGTRDRIQMMGLAWNELAILNDVDVAADLLHLPDEFRDWCAGDSL